MVMIQNSTSIVTLNISLHTEAQLVY